MSDESGNEGSRAKGAISPKVVYTQSGETKNIPLRECVTRRESNYSGQPDPRKVKMGGGE